MLKVRALGLALFTPVQPSATAPFVWLSAPGDWPEEGVAWFKLVQFGAELQLRIVPSVALDGPQAHGKHHKQDGKQDVGDQALPVSAAVMEPLD